MIYEPIRSRQPIRTPWTLERLVHAQAVTLTHAVSRSTKLSYNSATNSYLAFCHMHHCPIDPTPDTLSFFAVYMCHHINPKSVDNYLSGICNNLEAFFPDVCHARNSPLVSKTLAGCKRLHGRPARRKHALTCDNIACIHARLATSAEHDDHLFLTQLVSGFDALLRLRELVWPDKIALRSYCKISLRQSVQWYVGFGMGIPWVRFS
jgi:hypothetical protein